ncbi:MAG: hypothetical protein CMD25_01920 [Flavobacteriales bacterium]|jgi:hypothetical protein|nr:hypothetical protein [Flavobacteriales bacterium]|tara:strand:- start:958 stop:1953 length:996 start_codon:yes stop_codon:yes gene_type:complete
MMIKLTDIISESKVSYLTENFKSSILRKLSMGNNNSLDRDLYTYLAKQGLRASEIEDNHIEKVTKLPRKGVAIAVTSKPVTLRAKGNRYWERDVELEKGTIVTVFKDGKTLWYTKSWRNKDISVGNPTSWGSEDYKTFGLNKYGWQSPKAVRGISGIQYYHIKLEEDLPFMGGDKIRKLRQDIQAGSFKFRDDKSFKDENKRRYEDAIRDLYNDPEKVQAKIKKTKDYSDKLIQGLIGGKPNAESKKLMSQQNSKDMTDEMKAMAVLRDIADGMDRFYDKVRYYQQALEQDERDKEKYPDNQYMGKEASKYGKEIAAVSNLIIQGKFRGYF